MRRFILGLVVVILSAPMVRAEDSRTIDQLCSDLASDEPATREGATVALVEHGLPIRLAVLRVWADAEDPEVRERALQVLQEIDTSELVRCMTSFDGPCARAVVEAPAPSPCPPQDGIDLANLLRQVNSEDWSIAENALVRLNEVGHGALFDPIDPDAWWSSPPALHRIFVLVTRDRLAWGLDSWGRLLGADDLRLPQTLRGLDHEDVEALIESDPGDVTATDAKGRAERKTAKNTGVYTYCYDVNPPFHPTERTSPMGLLHQFGYEAETGLLSLWRVLKGPGEYMEMHFVNGRVAAMEASSGLRVTSR